MAWKIPTGKLPSCLLVSQFLKSMGKARLGKRNRSQVLFCLSASEILKLLRFEESITVVIRILCVICILLWLSLDYKVVMLFSMVKTVAQWINPVTMVAMNPFI